MYYCMYIIDIYTVYTHLSHLRVPFFEQVQANDPCVTLSVFMSQIIIHIRFFRGHFLEIKTLNTSTQWFQYMFLFQPLGEMIQFDESFHQWLAQPPRI